METKLFDPNTFSHWKEIDPESWQTIIQEIIDAFFAVVESQNANLQKGLTEKNFELIQASAHSMKSSLANVGCVAGSNVLKDIEQFAAEKNWEKLEVAQKQLQALYKPSIDALKEYRKNN